MKIFENKKLFKKIVMIMVLIVIVSFTFSGNVQAKNEGIGGKLLKPVVDLILSLNDGIYNIIHRIILEQDQTLLPISLTDAWWEALLTIVVFIGVAIAAAVAVIITAGAAAALIAAISGITLSAIGVGTVLIVSVGAGIVGAAIFNANAFPDDEIDLPVYTISPEEIFSNKLLMFDVDFFNPAEDKTLVEQVKEITGAELTDEEEEKLGINEGLTKTSTATKLRTIVATWYTLLRNIAIVALLSILVYTGIRIIISSTSSDKAKYKQMLVDWIVAMCLLFVMQYVMSFSNMIVEKVTELISNVNYNNDSIQLIPDKDEKISKALKDDYGYDDDEIDELYLKDGGNYQKDDDGNKYILWKTNLIGHARLMAQMERGTTATYAGYTIIFAALVLMTAFFVFTYLKRVIYMAFLTLIAPLVAMTYPLDKMNDGQAQAFNMWMKEYIFNLLIQPLHLLLYTVLITSAFELATSNIIYSLVAIGFMVPAEKLMRRFFGFEKAQTPGLLAGPAGAALTMTAMNQLLSKTPNGKGRKSGGSNSGESSSSDNGGGKIKDKIDDSVLWGGTPNNESAMPPNNTNNNPILPGGEGAGSDNMDPYGNPAFDINNINPLGSDEDSNNRPPIIERIKRS